MYSHSILSLHISHIVVSFRGIFYEVRVIKSDGSIISPYELANQVLLLLFVPSLFSHCKKHSCL